MEKNKKEKIVKEQVVEVKKEIKSESVNEQTTKKGCSKSIIIIAFIILVLVALYFIFFNKKVTICSRTLDQSASGYKINNEYKIKSLLGTAKTVQITDTITSKNNTILAYFEKQYKDVYTEQNKKYGGYTITSERKGDTVVVKAKIDFSKVKLSELAKDNTNISNDIKNNKLSLDGAKKLFTNMGAACEK